jgi:RHS repeat-associated protein
MTWAGNAPTIGFTGHVNDADTGLTYMQQRYYDPLAGRLLSIDPVTTDADTGSSFNRYDYAHNNPYKFVDPDGRNPLLKLLPRALIKTESKQVAKEAAKGAAREVEKSVAKEVTKDAAKSVPNPHGKAGGPAHQEKVADVAKDVESRGLTVEK